MNRRYHSPVRRSLWWLGGVLAIVPLGSVMAGPVTGGANNPPYVETAVYQGVVSIIPGGAGESLMEIGNLGQDIASTGDLNFRPQGVSGNNTAVKFTKNGGTGKTDLHVYGRLCLAGSCLDTWPTPGGTSYWTQNSTWLEPLTAGRGLVTDTSGPGTSTSDGFYVFGDHPDAATLVTKTTAGGLALTVDGISQINGSLDVTGALTRLDVLPLCGTFPANYTCVYPDDYTTSTVWHPGNDGVGSGLDASKIDGIDFDILHYPQDTQCGAGTTWCICGDFSATNSVECLSLQ